MSRDYEIVDVMEDEVDGQLVTFYAIYCEGVGWSTDIMDGDGTWTSYEEAEKHVDEFFSRYDEGRLEIERERQEAMREDFMNDFGDLDEHWDR